MADRDLIFFNKEGDSLNFNYNEDLERFEGNLLFHENSSDTFKTIGLYMFESLPAFSYQQVDDNGKDELWLNKFQLFNEFGIDFVGNQYESQPITKIEAVNNDTQFYSKWIYGVNFESKFPLGSELKFDFSIAEFTNTDKTYTVVGSKKGAVMIISDMDNKSFNTSYSGALAIDTTYDGKTVTGINAIEVHEYIDSSYNFNLSDWSEPQFFQKLFNGQKLSIVNSASNDGVVTVESKDLVDNSYFRYQATGVTSSLLIEYISGTDLPKIYNGTLNYDSSTNRITFGSDIPVFLRPGVQFQVPSSLLNTNFLTVDDIPLFNNTGLIPYELESQVLYNNEIYECILAYTQSVTSEITPEDNTYWMKSQFLPIDGTIANEFLANADIFLVDSILYFDYEFDTSSEITLASAVEKYRDELDVFNIDLSYKDGNIIADLRYSSQYAKVNFYNETLSNNITSTVVNYEKLIETEEVLVNEENRDLSELNSNNIVITDLDEFGLRVTVNGMVYYIDTSFSFIGATVDLDKTIDRTLRNWLSEHFIALVKLGIYPELIYTGNVSSIYVNTIKLTTVYPNVPLEFNVQVGSTAAFHIEHIQITFYDMGNVLNIVINGRSFLQQFNTDIVTTLADWVEQYQEYFFDIDVLVSSKNQVLYFDGLVQNPNINNMVVTIGKSSKPGEVPFKIEKKFTGNQGVIISSNEVIHANTNVNLEDEGFATGMLTTVNNSIYPLNNQEYNILYLDPDKITLSYQGPFWGNTQSYGTNAFLSFAFDSGYGFDPNGNNITVPITPTYSSTVIDVTANPVDIKYAQISESLYVLGEDVSVIDAGVGQVLTTIPLGATSGITLELNPVNNLLYALTSYKMYVIDPTLNQLTASYSLSNSYDLKINNLNGDVYITQDSSVQIYDSNNVFTASVTLTATDGQMVYNESEDTMYATSPLTNQTVRIDGDNKIITSTYSTPGVQNSLYYNALNSAVYGFTTQMFKILANNLTTHAINTTSFHDFSFNAYDDKMYVSTDAANELYEVSISDVITTHSIGDYGYVEYNILDSDIYISSQTSNQVIIFDTESDSISGSLTFSAMTDKMDYNYIRNSVWTILPTADQAAEVVVNITATPELEVVSGTGSITITDGMFGNLDPNFEEVSNLILKTREFIRRPRQNFETEDDIQVKYKWHWVDDQKPDMFIYDFSGQYLESSGAYAYTGVKPLPSGEIFLNREANRDTSRVSEPSAQQTIFDDITYTLDYVDSTTNLSFVPEPLELFLGFNSKDEGPYNSELVLTKIEEIEFDISTTATNNNTITFTRKENALTSEVWGEISLDVNSTEIFTDKLLKENQLIQLFVKDNTNAKKQALSRNNGKIFKIRNVYNRVIVVDFIDSNNEMVDETTIKNNYPDLGDTTYFTTTFKVYPKEIGRFQVYGQTEIEDIRFKIELNNVGKNLTPDDAFIFKEYDINEQGVDWTFLNKKRKEMLMVKPEIYNYIGAYKSIINAINLFGYNDLELYEYYRNINRKSPNFSKLFKVEIPDIFDNTVDGWEASDFIKNTFPNENFESTNLFNLTYRITDNEGTSVLAYSLDEVIIKLSGLKNWLEKNIIPITHDILDITGRTDTVGATTLTHENYDVTILNINNEMTPVNFAIEESYLLPINNGSSVYNVVLRPFTEDENYPEYYHINIRTYQVYDEWDVFTTYASGDKVSYLGRLYESAIDGNKLNNPKKYEDAPSWSPNFRYVFGQVVEYNRRYYQYSVIDELVPAPSPTPTTTNFDPPFDNEDWLDVTEWKIIDMSPVQKISEYRYDSDLNEFNFTLDSSVDPFVIVEVTSDNGYGQNYTVRKSFEIRVNADSDEAILVSANDT
jgi:hypothetical protein